MTSCIWQVTVGHLSSEQANRRRVRVGDLAHAPISQKFLPEILMRLLEIQKTSFYWLVGSQFKLIFVLSLGMNRFFVMRIRRGRQALYTHRHAATLKSFVVRS